MNLPVLPSGTKTFYIRYTFNGKEKVHKLGQYPFGSLVEARTEYNKCVEMIKDGLDPGDKTVTVYIEKSVETLEGKITVGWMVKKHLEWSEVNHNEDWYKINKQTLDKHMRPEWGDTGYCCNSKRVTNNGS